MVELMTLTELISLTKIRATNYFKFFSNAIMNIPVIITETIERAGTTGTKILINPKFIDNLIKIENEYILIGLLLHEILHIQLEHVWRKGKRNIRKWNIATDIVVNNILKMNNIPRPKGGIELKNTINKSAEEIYNILPDNIIDNEQWDIHDFWGEKDTNRTELMDGNEIERIKAKNRTMLLNNKEKIPNGMVRDISELKSPSIDYRVLLSEYISPYDSEYTYHPSDRRFYHMETNIPELKDNEELNIVLAIDTSGSIDKELITLFVNRAFDIIHSFENINGYIAFCDFKLNNWMQLTKELKKEELKKYILGGRLTDFTPVFNKVKELNIKPSILIYLTDLMGNIPDYIPEYPVIWAIPNIYREKLFNYKTVFGKLIFIK